MKFLADIGSYFIMLGKVFRAYQTLCFGIWFERNRWNDHQLWVLLFLSPFSCGVIAIKPLVKHRQPFYSTLPSWFQTNRSFWNCPTFICIIMAGKMGSFITSSIGPRVTEQTDALEVMALTLNYLCFQIALQPSFCDCRGHVSGILGGWAAAVYGGF